jgi:hypothetical protein
LSEAQAFTKVYESDRGLRARHHAERVAKFGWELRDGKLQQAENVA